MVTGLVVAGIALLAVAAAAVRSPRSMVEPRRVRPGGGVGRDGQAALAGLGRRFWGAVIDAFVLAPVVVVRLVVRHTRFIHRVDPATGLRLTRVVSDHPSVIAALLLLVPSALYTVGLIAVYGQTLGERALRVRVVRRSDSAAPGWNAAARRWALPAGPSVVAVVAPTIGEVLSLVVVVDFLWAVWDRNRQCLHDKFADTLVLDAS